jgi:hypothetical protein
VKIFNIYFLTLILLTVSSCDFSGDDSAGTLFSGHLARANKYTVTTLNSANYKEGDTISFTLEHPVTQIVTGTPRLLLDIGGTTVYANYTSGDGTRFLTFDYTVSATDNDNDGIELSSSIDLNGGSLTFDTIGGIQSSNITITAPNLNSVLVDTIDPNITLVSAPSDGTYFQNQIIQYIVLVDEVVTVSGSPRISLNIGGSTSYATYITGSGTTTLLFQKVVSALDIDNDGIEVSSPIELNSGSIVDAAGNELGLVFADTHLSPPLSNINISGNTPYITSIIPPTNGNYTTGTNIDITVIYNENVDVTGTPAITTTLSSGSINLSYISGSGSTNLLFRYTVTALDNDNDGIQINSPIILSGGTIQNTSSTDANLNFTNPTTPSVYINQSIASVTIDSMSPINLANAGVYTMTGNCTENGTAVNVDIGGVTGSDTCGSGTYSVTLNVTGVADNASVAVTADHATATGATATVLKDVIPPTTASLDALSDINVANSTSYAFTGTCSEDTENITYTIGALTSTTTCSTTTFSFSSVDVSSEADSATFAISIEHFDAAGNSSTDSGTVVKDTALPTVTITSSPDISNANVTSYQVIGTCSENGQTVTVDIGGITDTPTCSSSTFLTSSLDVSSLADGSVTITATHAKTNGNSNSDTTSVTKDLTPTVAITTPADDIDSSNETSYSILGTCSENGVDVDIDVGGVTKTVLCSSGAWTSGTLDVSGVSDGTVTITADHSTATQSSTTVNKDSAAEVVTITSAPDISGGNETAYTVSGTCTTNSSAVTVDIGGLSFTPTCTSNAWSTGVVDVSSLADGTITITADHTTATGASTSVNKDTTSPTVDSLSVATTLSDSADITWNLNDPGGFTIDDYIINYRVKGSSTWLPFADGVSTATSATVTGLTESTTYEFRVNVQYNTTNNSPWSNTTEGETLPNSSYIGPNKAMNIGGATSSTVAAFQDGTNITLNGSALVTLNKGQTHTFTSAQFDIIDADKPIFTAGRRGSGGDVNKANVAWNPSAWGGKEFSFNAIRYNAQKLHVFALEDATVEIKQGSTVLTSATVTEGNGTTLSWSVYGSYQVISSGAILAFHASNNTVDPKPLPPSSLEIIGFPSNSMRITTDEDSTNYTLRHSDSTLTTGSMNKADSITVNGLGSPRSYYQGESLLVTSDKKVSGASFADSNGSCAAAFLPTNLMKKKYIINVSADYVACASKASGTINVIDSSDTTIATLTLTRTGSDSNAPYRARRATSAAGLRFVSTVPMACWYQPNTDTGAADRDETVMYGTDD